MSLPALHRRAAAGAGGQPQHDPHVAAGPARRARGAAAGGLPALARVADAGAHPARAVAAAQDENLRRQRAARPPPAVGAGPPVAGRLPRDRHLQPEGW